VENKIYIIPMNENKLIKIIHEELPCPLLFNTNIDFRCKYAKTKSEGMDFIIFCSSKICDCISFEAE